MESRYNETHRTWNKLAALYEEKFMELDLYTATYQQFCELLDSPQASILEIGCGPGNITKQILKQLPELDILATDVSENMVTLAQKNNPSIRTQVLDCRHLDSLQGTFDGILCGFTLPYLAKQDIATLFQNCSVLLKSKGVFYVSFVEGAHENSGFISGSSGDKTFFYYYDFQTIEQFLKEGGFSIINSSKIEYKKEEGSIEIHGVVLAQKNQ